MLQRRSQPDQTLGKILDSARQEADLSVRQLADLTGVPKSSIDRLLHDQTLQPLPEHLVALARALELNATDLFLLADLPVPNEAASLEIMLRKGYGVSDREMPGLKREIEALIAKRKQER